MLNLDALQFCEWNSGEADIPGMSCWDWFTADGIYKGADSDGLEPVFA